jgi:hypothetical protein
VSSIYIINMYRNKCRAISLLGVEGCAPVSFSMRPPLHFIRHYFQPNRGKNINHNFYIAPDTLKCEAFADIERERMGAKFYMYVCMYMKRLKKI